jgi:hypothetical protein
MADTGLKGPTGQLDGGTAPVARRKRSSLGVLLFVELDKERFEFGPVCAAEYRRWWCRSCATGRTWRLETLRLRYRRPLHARIVSGRLECFGAHRSWRSSAPTVPRGISCCDTKWNWHSNTSHGRARLGPRHTIRRPDFLHAVETWKDRVGTIAPSRLPRARAANERQSLRSYSDRQSCRFGWALIRTRSTMRGRPGAPVARLLTTPAARTAKARSRRVAAARVPLAAG